MGTGDVQLDPAAVAALLARLNALPSVMTGALIEDEQSGKKRLKFDTYAHRFAGASGLASAVELARRATAGVKDARTVVEALDRGFAHLVETASGTLTSTAGADTTATEVINRNSDR